MEIFSDTKQLGGDMVIPGWLYAIGISALAGAGTYFASGDGASSAYAALALAVLQIATKWYVETFGDPGTAGAPRSAGGPGSGGKSRASRLWWG